MAGGSSPTPRPAASRAPHLHALQQPRERLLPRQRVHVLLRVDDADLTLQLGDDGACAPAMPQHEVLGGQGDWAQQQPGETPHLPQGAPPPLPPGHCRGGPQSRALGGRAIPSAAGSQTGFPGGRGVHSYAHCAVGAPLGLLSSRLPQPPEAARPDAGLPFPAALGPLWALALAASPSHSGRGSAHGRKASPPCALTPVQATAQVHSGKQTAAVTPWPCSQQATPAHQ